METQRNMRWASNQRFKKSTKTNKLSEKSSTIFKKFINNNASAISFKNGHK